MLIYAHHVFFDHALGAPEFQQPRGFACEVIGFARCHIACDGQVSRAFDGGFLAAGGLHLLCDVRHHQHDHRSKAAPRTRVVGKPLCVYEALRILPQRIEVARFAQIFGDNDVPVHPVEKQAELFGRGRGDMQRIAAVLRYRGLRYGKPVFFQRLCDALGQPG